MHCIEKFGKAFQRGLTLESNHLKPNSFCIKTQEKIYRPTCKYLVVPHLVQLEGGQAGDLGGHHIVGHKVNLGNHNAIVILVLFSQLIVNRFQLLALLAPEIVN